MCPYFYPCLYLRLCPYLCPCLHSCSFLCLYPCLVYIHDDTTITTLMVTCFTTPTTNLMRTLSLNPNFDISIFTVTMIFSPCLEQYFIYTSELGYNILVLQYIAILYTIAILILLVIILLLVRSIIIILLLLTKDIAIYYCTIYYILQYNVFMHSYSNMYLIVVVRSKASLNIDIK
jgi:hypothetical protein